MIEVKDLNEDLEPLFYEYISNDEPNYYFFILDWKYSREDTKILIAQENRKIKGTMLVFKNRIISIRGSLDAAESLLNEVDLDDVEANCYEEHKSILLKKYEPTMEHIMMLMKLVKVNDSVHQKYPLTKLGTEDAEEASKIIRESLPIHWSQVCTEEISSRINEGDPCYCIKEDGRIVSVALAKEKNFGEKIGILGYINAVATVKDYMNRGYATSMVSQLSRKLLERSKYVLISLLSDNIPAFKAYSRVGFKPVRSYYFMRGHKIMC